MVCIEGKVFSFERQSSTKKIDVPKTPEASELIFLGNAAFSSGKHTRGIELISKALEISENEQPNSLKVADLLTMLGNMYIEAGIGNGFNQHSRALEIRSKVQPNTEAEAESLESVGLILLSFYQYFEAMKHLEKSLQFHVLHNPLSIKTAMQYTHVGKAQRSLGRFDNSYKSLNSSLLILQNFENSFAESANIHFLFGSWLREDGVQLGAAQSHLNEAISLYSIENPSSIEISNCYLEIAKLKYAKGLSKEELLYYGKAFEIQIKVAPASLDCANTLHQLGLYYNRRGQSTFAQKYLEHSLSIRQISAPLSLASAETLYYLGEVKKNQGEISSALEFHERALELRSRLVPISIIEAESFHAVGDLLQKLGRWKEALNHYAKEFIARDTDAVETAKVHNIIGNILFRETDRINDCVSNHQMAVAIQSSYGKSELLAKYLKDLIWAVKKKGDDSSKYEQQLQEVISNHMDQN